MIFLTQEEILVIHDRAIAEFGGPPGIRDAGALESAIVAVENRHLYEKAALITCAATYAYHLCKAHAFTDGNKRVAAAATEIFLRLNDAWLDTTNDQFVDFFMSIAAGEISRDKAEVLLREWVKQTYDAG